MKHKLDSALAFIKNGNITVPSEEGDFVMGMIQVGTVDVHVKPDGYLLNFDDWTPELAEAMAKEDGIELTECHWVALQFMREFYSTYDIPPSPRTMIKEVGAKLDRHCTRDTLERLFPKGGCKHACRLAGLPEGYTYAC